MAYNEWFVRGPMLAVIITLAFLYLDCRSIRDEVAIKLLDSSTVRGSSRFSVANWQQQATKNNVAGTTAEAETLEGPEDARDAQSSQVAPAPACPPCPSPPPPQPCPSPAPAPPCPSLPPPQPCPSPAPPCPSPPPPQPCPLQSQQPPPSPSPAPSFELVVPDLSSYNASVLPDIAKQVLELERQGKGRKVISMSLFGNELRYTEGAVDNAALARRFWKDWTFRVYYGDGVPPQTIEIIRALGAELIRVNTTQAKASSTLWRFMAVMDRTVTRFIVRDIDGRLSNRDKAAVQEWIDSGRYFHTMHDAVQHTQPILGGLWGTVNGFLNPKLFEPLLNEKQAQNWGIDQDWLGSVLWPNVQNYTIDHSAYNCGDFKAADNRGFPMQREHSHDFVGNVHFPWDYVGYGHSGPCPERCRRNINWTNC